MIYLDNSATTLTKPENVGKAVCYALSNFGNPGRSFHDAAMTASREVFKAREAIAKLTSAGDPLNVAFTSSATESLNLVIHGLIKSGDHVITTVTEHNSVLRPLYKTGCALDFIDCDDEGVLDISRVRGLIRPETGFLICTHASNVTGNVTDVHELYEICKENRLTMILDVSQTLGVIETNLGMADVLCFTGHKGMLGHQGTGGVITKGRLPFSPVKTGGAGANSFEPVQSGDMPDVFEAGTLNSHGIYGLQKAVEFINETGVETIFKKEKLLNDLFYQNMRDVENVVIYGNFSSPERIPVISLNVMGLTSAELSWKLWDDYKIATRSGVHCAPLLHKRMNTADQGMTRFSFSYFNTMEEAEIAAAAVKEIAKQAD